MKHLYTLTIIAAFALKSHGQTTFNIRDRYDFLACVLTSVVPTDSCYYVTGIIADTIFPYSTSAVFMKMDLEGNMEWQKTLKSTEKTYETWYNSLVALSDGSFFNVGSAFDTIWTGLLIKYNSVGDTAFIKEYLNPYYPNANWIKPWGGAELMPDGGMIISFWISTTNDFFGNDTNIYLVRTDSLGNMVWGKIYGTPKWERPMSIKVTGDGKIVCGGIRTNETTNVQNYTYQCHIFQVDSAGNLEWEYLSPISAGLRDAANDMILLDDGSIIVASGIGHEELHPSFNEVNFDPYVLKLNPQHQIEWELTFPNTELNNYPRTTNLVEMSDGSGYILAGLASVPPIPQADYGTIRGSISKISLGGDSIWTRKYAYEVSNPYYIPDIYDMKETMDGGLILSGEVLDVSADATYPQQGWLLKLDEHGCLVPGCHLSDATDENSVAPLIKLAIFPNPTADYLNFYVHASNPAREVTFRIVDGEGHIVKAFKTNNLASTFIVPVWDWASGVYWLQYEVGGFILDSEKFIKL
jgi:Secretion system C-terminal sorting domain